MALQMWGQVVIQATMPQEDPVKVGTLWIDTSGTAALKVCTSISPYTFAAITSGVAWGSITGTLSSQTDVQAALDAKAATSHTHSAADITSGSLADARRANAVEQTTTATGTQNNFSLSGKHTYLRCNNASALVFTGFTVGGAAPVAGDTVIVENIGSSTVRVAHQDTGSTAAYRALCPSVSGQTLGAGGRLMCVYDDTTDRWREQVIYPGSPVLVAFDAANFVGSGSMTWTVGSGDQTSYQYIQTGCMLHLVVRVDTTTVGGTLDSALEVVIPSPFVATGGDSAVGWAEQSGGGYVGSTMIIINPSGRVRIFRADVATWAASTNTTRVQITLDLSIT
jgi:hypothetical protein